MRSPLLIEALAKLRGEAGEGRTVRFCKRCGGEHAGACRWVGTSYGTSCRPEIRDALEARAALVARRHAVPASFIENAAARKAWESGASYSEARAAGKAGVS